MQFRSRKRLLVSLGWALAVVVASWLGESAAGLADTPGKLPTLGAKAPAKETSGRIVESSRGQTDPVRLILESDGGEEVVVLVGPNGLCDRLGLSLRPGEEVAVVGRELPGAPPLLVAKTLVVAGQAVVLRDEMGRIVEPPVVEKTSPSAVAKEREEAAATED